MPSKATKKSSSLPRKPSAKTAKAMSRAATAEKAAKYGKSVRETNAAIGLWQLQFKKATKK